MANEKWTTDNIADQKGRVVVITGSTSGLGKQAAKVLAGKNATVVMAVRNTDKGEAVASELKSVNQTADIQVRKLDLSDLSSVKAFADSFKADFASLDVLINNAGVMMCPYGKTTDGFEMQIGTNHFGHFALTAQLFPLLQQTADSRIVNVSSLAHGMGRIDFDDINWERRRYVKSSAYGDSKLANLYFTYELSRRLGLNAANPKVVAAHPGWTATDLQRHSGLFSFLNPLLAQKIPMGTLPVLRAAMDPEVKSGTFYGPAKLWNWRGYPVAHKSNKLSYNNEAAVKLWSISEELTGVAFPI